MSIKRILSEVNDSIQDGKSINALKDLRAAINNVDFNEIEENRDDLNILFEFLSNSVDREDYSEDKLIDLINTIEEISNE